MTAAHLVAALSPDMAGDMPQDRVSPEPLPFEPLGNGLVDRFLAREAGSISVMDKRDALYRINCIREDIGEWGPARSSAFLLARIRMVLGNWETEVERRNVAS